LQTKESVGVFVRCGLGYPKFT